jgi:hypothetical protein
MLECTLLLMFRKRIHPIEEVYVLEEMRELFGSSNPDFREAKEIELGLESEVSQRLLGYR